MAPAVGLSLVSLPGYDADPCPFGYGSNCGGGNLSPATRAQVANILQGILSNLNKNKALVQDNQKVIKSGLTAKAATTSEARKALKGIILRLQQRNQASVAKALGGMFAAATPDAGCLYFGACGGGNRPIDSQTKAQVAAILNGILSNLSSQK